MTSPHRFRAGFDNGVPTTACERCGYGEAHAMHVVVALAEPPPVKTNGHAVKAVPCQCGAMAISGADQETIYRTWLALDAAGHHIKRACHPGD